MCFRLAGVEAIRAMIAKLGLSGTTAELTCRALVLGLFEGASPDTPMAEYLRNQDADAYRLCDRMYRDDGSPNDLTSPRDMVNFFTLLYRGEVVSAEDSRAMMDIMRRCQTNGRIPHLLPDRGPGKAAVIHKTGTLPCVANDCGIVLSGDKAYALALYYNGFGKDEPGRETSDRLDAFLAELSYDVFTAVTGA